MERAGAELYSCILDILVWCLSQFPAGIGGLGQELPGQGYIYKKSANIGLWPRDRDLRSLLLFW